LEIKVHVLSAGFKASDASDNPAPATSPRNHTRKRTANAAYEMAAMKKSPPTQLPAILERATLALRRSQRPPKRDAPRALKGIPRSFTTEDQRCFSPESRHPGRPSARLLCAIRRHQSVEAIWLWL
jgi:hypothetical protein